LEIKTRKLKQHLFSWYRNNKRTFSWRNTNDPWKIFLIEIISQQTQINRADDYYKKFIKEFPTPESMAKSSLKKVLELWSGLGYNNRAKRLYESSKMLSESSFDSINPNFEILPGVGPYTKNAILSFAYGDSVLAIDTNLERIITRYFGVDDAKDYLKRYSQSLLKKVNSKDLNQAFMDFGSMVCTSLSPSCDICPLETECSKYFSKIKKSYQKFEGSNREIRGKVLKLLLNEDQISKEELINKLGEEEEKLNKALHGLQKDNLLIIKKNNIIEINSK
jgi:A/G-specific adenine glycosylase